jgi:hypothetical protein
MLGTWGYVGQSLKSWLAIETRQAPATKKTLNVIISVVDPGSEFFSSRIRISSIPGPGFASKNLSILSQKMVSKLF